MLTVAAPTARFLNLAPATSYTISVVCILASRLQIPALSTLTIKTPDLGCAVLKLAGAVGRAGVRAAGGGWLVCRGG